jgi:hypothetical protein
MINFSSRQKNHKYYISFTVHFTGFVAKHFYLHFLQMVVQLSVLYQDLISWNQAKIKLCVNTLSAPSKRIGLRTVGLHCHKTFEFFNISICWLLEPRKQVRFEDIYLLKFFYFSFEMIWIVLCVYSSGFKNINNRILYCKARLLMCCYILIWFDNGSYALNVLHTTFMLNLMFYQWSFAY